MGVSIQEFEGDFHVTFQRLSKVKLMTASYVPLETIQLLSDIFFSKNASFPKYKSVTFYGGYPINYIYCYAPESLRPCRCPDPVAKKNIYKQ